ncbi:TRAP transporter small permease subunit [Bradyrhizobium sp.]|uniref:TRAP transporter small permease subunit n=1 Tax=Bradyrhizobium sp. TaxID=376 RepID=UPI0027310963|nr:TRAP transporter small permease subunit [Bradyrhizobium sp.]MDP3077542.1 TRAP transporter small permease subunit [Bradyrhizobium sp.]
MKLTGTLLRAANLLDRVIERIGRVTGWFALALVLVMSFNVLLRYLFRTGSVAMQELEWHLMAPVCMLGLSYAILKDGHVLVDIFYGRLSERWKRIIDFVSAVLVVAVVFILLKLSIPYVLQSYSIGEKSPDPGGLTHRWVLKAMLPVGFALLLVQSFAAMLRALVPVIDPNIAVKPASHAV